MNYAELNRIVDESGLLRSHISKQMNMNQAVFCDRMKGRSEWKVKDVIAFCRVLNISKRQMNDIFFGQL